MVIEGMNGVVQPLDEVTIMADDKFRFKTIFFNPNNRANVNIVPPEGKR